LLELDGADLCPLPLGERRTKLAKVLVRKPAGIVFNEHTDEDGAPRVPARLRARAGGDRVEAIERPYRSGPSRDWIKIKNPEARRW
jgi:bifunctional non-homologous end joining protein LigD